MDLARYKQTSGEDYSGDWGERHDEQLTDSTAQMCIRDSIQTMLEQRK